MARFLSSLFLLALIVCAVLVTWPQLAGLEHTEPFLQLVSLRGLSAALAVLLIVFLLIVGFVIRPWRAFLGAVCTIALLFAAANVGVLVWRGLGNEALPTAQRDDVTVLSWNTLGDQVSAEAVGRLVTEHDARVVVLPETTEELAQRVAQSLNQAPGGRRFVAHTNAYDGVYAARSTSVLVDAALGRYQLDTAAGFPEVLPSVVLRPLNAGSPTIVGVHAMAPLGEGVPSWREHMRWLEGVCATPNTIVAGDFNATPDHLTALADCSLASVQAGTSGTGTWHTALPGVLGAPIDHVLSTPEWEASGATVLTEEDRAGSDHRPVLARLSPVPTAP